MVNQKIPDPFQYNEGKLTNENRKYWHLRDTIPTEEQQYLISPIFTLHNVDWWYCVCIYKDKRSVLISVFCTLPIAYQFDVRVGIFGDSGENIFMSNAKAGTSAQFNVLNSITISELYSIVNSNELGGTFFVEIEKKDEETLQKEKNEAKEKKRKEKEKVEERKEKAKFCKRKFETDYKELLLSGKNSDFTINVKHRKFNCHAIILGARSPVFSAMMEHDMKEKRGREVSIPDADPAAFQDFLLYLYTGKEENLNWENITDLYKLGDKYCVEDLKYFCVERMKTNISTENFFDIFIISQQHNDSELSEAAIEFFLKNSEDIKTKKWTEFMKEYPDETYVLTKAEENIKAERGIFSSYL